MVDVLSQGGTLVDATGAPGFASDIRIKSGNHAALAAAAE
jgi:N-acyl-D-aspartate/D-glutamate deacylase